MKKINITLGAILTTGILFFAACDYVKNPVQKTTTTGGNSTGGDSVVRRKALVEDYTGHECGNCPRQGRILHQLKETIYHEKLIVLTVHAGGFATPHPTHNPPYPTDFQTSEGTTYNNNSDFGIIANPAFMINRTYYTDWAARCSYTAGNGNLSGKIDSVVAAAADFKIDLSGITYDNVNNKINGVAKVTALKSITGGLYKMVLVLSEDSVIAEQKDDDDTGPTTPYVPLFTHRDVFRGTINGAYGTTVFAGATVASGVSDSVSMQAFLITPANYHPTLKPDHCNIVAYIYNADVNSPKYYELFQVEEKELK